MRTQGIPGRRIINGAKRRAREALMPAKLMRQYKIEASMTHGCRVARVYWWSAERNFGDELNPWLLAKYGIASVQASPETAQISAVGSVLQLLPTEFDGYIWGSGIINDSRLRLPNAKFLALRGEFTQRALGAGTEVALGDPGLLIGKHVKHQRVSHTLGLVPHYYHKESELVKSMQARYGSDIKIIDVQQGPESVAEQISQCSAILSSSLHGLIFADSMGKPAAWFEDQPSLTGGRFKFQDYSSVVSPNNLRLAELNPDSKLKDVMLTATTADRTLVERSMQGLEEAIARMRPLLAEGPAPSQLTIRALDAISRSNS